MLAGLSEPSSDMFEPLDVISRRRRSTKEISQQWLLCSQMTRLMGQSTTTDQLETLTGLSKNYCRRLENASWRMWATSQVEPVVKAVEDPTTQILAPREAPLRDAADQGPTGFSDRFFVAEPSVASLSAAPPSPEPSSLSTTAPSAELPVVAAAVELPQTMATARRPVPAPQPGAECSTPPPLLHQLGTAVVFGGVAGSVSRAVAHPLDTLRVLRSAAAPTAALEAPLLQRVAAAGSNGVHALGAGVKAGVTAFRTVAKDPVPENPLYDLRQLRKSVGILYRGFGVSVIGAAPVFSLYFGGFEVAKRVLAGWLPGEKSKDARAMAAGFAAECACATLWVPWEVVRQRMQLSGRASFAEVGSEIVATSGWRGLYVGTREYMMMWGVYSPLCMMMYERGMSHLSARRQEHGVAGPPSAAASFAVGCTSGFVAALLTSPIDLVKTRMQCQTPESPYQYTGMADGLREVVRAEGARGLFRGAIPRAFTMSLSIGVLMTSYSSLKNAATRRLEERTQSR